MNSFLDSVIRQGTNAHDSILEHSAIRLDDYHQVHVYVASQKRPPKRNHPIRWKSPMLPVYDKERGLLRVKKEHENEYSVASV